MGGRPWEKAESRGWRGGGGEAERWLVARDANRRGARRSGLLGALLPWPPSASLCRPPHLVLPPLLQLLGAVDQRLQRAPQDLFVVAADARLLADEGVGAVQQLRGLEQGGEGRDAAVGGPGLGERLQSAAAEGCSGRQACGSCWRAAQQPSLPPASACLSCPRPALPALPIPSRLPAGGTCLACLPACLTCVGLAPALDRMRRARPLGCSSSALNRCSVSTICWL